MSTRVPLIPQSTYIGSLGSAGVTIPEGKVVPPELKNLQLWKMCLAHELAFAPHRLELFAAILDDAGTTVFKHTPPTNMAFRRLIGHMTIGGQSLILSLIQQSKDKYRETYIDLILAVHKANENTAVDLFGLLIHATVRVATIKKVLQDFLRYYYFPKLLDTMGHEKVVELFATDENKKLFSSWVTQFKTTDNMVYKTNVCTTLAMEALSPGRATSLAAALRQPKEALSLWFNAYFRELPTLWIPAGPKNVDGPAEDRYSILYSIYSVLLAPGGLVVAPVPPNVLYYGMNMVENHRRLTITPYEDPELPAALEACYNKHLEQRVSTFVPVAYRYNEWAKSAGIDVTHCFGETMKQLLPVDEPPPGLTTEIANFM